MLGVQIALALVGGQHHDHVRPFGGLRRVHHLDAGGLRLGGTGGARAQRDHEILHAGILQVERVRVALAAIADDRDLFALDQVNVGVPVIINAHVCAIPRFAF
jgi:hypothetical protein